MAEQSWVLKQSRTVAEQSWVLKHSRTVAEQSWVLEQSRTVGEQSWVLKQSRTVGEQSWVLVVVDVNPNNGDHVASSHLVRDDLFRRYQSCALNSTMYLS